MSEDIADIIFEGLPKEKRYLADLSMAVTIEICIGRCNLEYIKEKMEAIMNAVEKMRND